MKITYNLTYRAMFYRKLLFLHNGNLHPSASVGYAAHMKETYKKHGTVVEAHPVDQEQLEYLWKSKSRRSAVWNAAQIQYTKYCCYIRERASRTRKLHYIKKKWPPQKNLVPGQKNVAHEPLVDLRKIFSPLPHIKLWLMKKIVKVMDKESEDFHYLRQMFPGITDAKSKEGIFDLLSPQIRYIINDNDKWFEDLTPEKIAWKAFKDVIENFLGNYRASKYIQGRWPEFSSFTYYQGIDSRGSQEDPLSGTSADKSEVVQSQLSASNLNLK